MWEDGFCPLPIDQVVEYAVQIAAALDKVHRHGVTHRDLKPGNIMLTGTGAKLLDFGLAKMDVGGFDSAGLLSAAPVMLTRDRPTPFASHAARFSLAIPQENAVTSRMRVSPDGRFLSYAADFEGQTHIWVRPIDSLDLGGHFKSGHLAGGREWLMFTSRRPRCASWS